MQNREEMIKDLVEFWMGMHAEEPLLFEATVRELLRTTYEEMGTSDLETVWRERRWCIKMSSTDRSRLQAT